MIHAIVGSILSCMLACASIVGLFMSGGSNNGLIACNYRPSIHFQIDEKNGSFIPISDLLQNRNKLLHTIMKEARYTRHMRINNK